ncbi:MULTISPECIES: lipid IV(A) 3-deoxy-D-manno-octulosonic acid transferase [unclassified Gilliamella]|uniref:lipid IV(A) 3-deoxy-D-manno-octulosonic acid transferase n=1 Tax=unclassified Gilliamella TaxID=2685620 RepID=UPI002269BBCD|nr:MULTISPECIES: lipid IV(A) 3-deoxy-D-manno-octulosonic acid transferase [unclassified Gilliamella]MCX8574997.1 lipid IV(A) 3-deoxy-D-manno-octulosonic acid transferase [Gilliamella sp. B3831]MCX8577379.1 lipid IV(A) 3-deoxy-D-manno-octulosonic acid transferase [Gilliamella sp. B3815]MCX8590095.1 lipid IV(A) 3-deoxy-D-manno-octulosonic acid transferase [Gilliamella sp. B3812]MCX8604329.1 lipid IV(A) 3-deoxy-D-manno-octulosonic acid transferase [Gilliamella sp. B3823]MCX8606389.1 lipid IV(A) 3
MQIIYTLLLYLIQPFVWLKLLWRSRKAPAYRQRWLERYGFCKNKVKPNGILVHAVSVGETIAAIPLIKALQQKYPQLPITVTTMTPTGSERVKSLLKDSVSHVYLPYDLPGAIKRFLKTTKPKIVIIMETELWPNLISQCYKQKIPLIIANARLSERSAARYGKLGKAVKQLFSKISMVAAQNQQDGERFVSLGLPADHLAITGSIKFDINLSNEQRQNINQLKQQWQLKRPVLIAASTHSGEDEIILTAFKKLLLKHANLLLILVPRHPERFKTVEKLISDNGFNYLKRSTNQIPTEQTQIVLGDTMGELVELYAMADIAFVGGSLVKQGGHNPLEPALHHIAIITGEYFFNFQVICEQLIEAQGMIVCTNSADDLYSTIDRLLNDNSRRVQLGENAYLVLKQNQGALSRLLAVINHYLNIK